MFPRRRAEDQKAMQRPRRKPPSAATARGAASGPARDSRANDDPLSIEERTDAARQQKRSFLLIAGTFVALLLISLAASWAAIDVVNSTRTYATGEGRYSKAQKIAVLYLHRYAHSGRLADYQSYLEAIDVRRGTAGAGGAAGRP